MSAKTLISFSALIDFYPNFVIPVFDVRGTNNVCVQNLDAFSVISQFHSFNPDNFFTVQAAVPRLSVDVGDDGIFAFWIDKWEVVCGNRDYVAKVLDQLDIATLPEFIGVEVATFLSDKKKITDAAKRAQPLIANAKARLSYIDNTLNRLAVADIVKQQQKAEELKEINPLEAIMHQLETDISDREWYNIWFNAALNQFAWDKLDGILEWRLASLGLGAYEHAAINLAMDLRFEKTGSYDYVVRWLDYKPFDSRGWDKIWHLLFDRFPKSSQVIEIGFSYILSWEGRGALVNAHPLQIWKKLRLAECDIKTLNSLAVRLARNEKTVPDDFARNVLSTMVRVGDTPEPLLAYIDQWLSNPRATNVWVDLFVKASRLKVNPDHRDEQWRAGFEWLYRLGRGSNQWMKLWRFMKSSLDEKSSTELLSRWLNEARINLASWPTVFLEALDNFPDNTEVFKGAAKRWLLYGTGPLLNERIHKAFGEELFSGDSRTNTSKPKP